MIRWDLRDSVPEVALLRFDLRDVGQHHLLELRSLLDELSGPTPVQLKVRAPQGWVTYATEGIRLDTSRIEQLENSCPWLSATLTVDRQRLLAERSQQPYGQRPAPTVDVPF